MMESLVETVCSVEIGGMMESLVEIEIGGFPWKETDYTYVDTEISSGEVERSRSTVEEMCYPPESVEIESTIKVNKANIASVNRHPPYKRMILEAMNATMERTTCSWPAIAKSIREKYMETLPHDFKKKLSKELRDLTERGVLVRTKNSFKFAQGFKNYDGVDYDEIEPVQDERGRGEARRRNKPRGSNIFVFKLTVHNPHFH